MLKKGVHFFAENEKRNENLTGKVQIYTFNTLTNNHQPVSKCECLGVNLGANYVKKAPVYRAEAFPCSRRESNPRPTV